MKQLKQLRKRGNANSIELWRWKMVTLLSNFIHPPDDKIKLELVKVVQNYRC